MRNQGQLLLATIVIGVMALGAVSFARAEAWAGLVMTLLFGLGGLAQWARIGARLPGAARPVLTWVLIAQIAAAIGGHYAGARAECMAQLADP